MTARIDIAVTLARLPAFPQLRGKHLRLRGPRADDADALFALFSDPAVMRYWSRPPMTTRGEAEGLIGEMREAFQQRTLLNWMITTRDDDRVIGTCTLFRFDPRHRHAEVGYALRSDHWGKGLAREAVSLALDWAFRTLDLQRIEADIDPGNDGSRQLLLRLGFASEGVLRQRFFVGDVVSDSEVFGLLAEDWRNRQV
ncbi:MAG TPA: GNAT family N-acetyltransferase [Luteimonas sp.]|nr:GNAT family N-acetyltransferase [Luteimonas sp.]